MKYKELKLRIKELEKIEAKSKKRIEYLLNDNRKLQEVSKKLKGTFAPEPIKREQFDKAMDNYGTWEELTSFFKKPVVTLEDDPVWIDNFALLDRAASK